MKNKKTLLIITIIVLPFLIYALYKSYQRNQWIDEPSKIKYSEKRELEVWGKILRGNDAALFYGTPLYEVANELDNWKMFMDKEKIIHLIDQIPQEYINYQERKYGSTIGDFALFTNNLFAVKKLLDRGLNPNSYGSRTYPLIIEIFAARWNKDSEIIDLLKYMIQKGADVNIEPQINPPYTPLIEANKIEYCKILIQAGADPHYKNRLGDTALSRALMRGNIKVVNYLIFEQQVDFYEKIPLDSKFHPGEYKVLHDLRDMSFELNSKEYQEKMKLVAFLKTKGLDYWKTAIPEHIKTNTARSKEYLSKY